MFGQAIQAHDPLLMVSDPSVSSILRAVALPNFHESNPTVYPLWHENGAPRLYQTRNGVFTIGSTAVSLFRSTKLTAEGNFTWDQSAIWELPTGTSFPGIGADNSQSFISSVPVTSNKILFARAQQVQQTAGAMVYGWLKYTTAGNTWDTNGTWTFTPRKNSYNNSEKYISTFVSNSTDVFCLYKTSTNAIVKYNINTDTELSPSFSPSLGATSYFKQMMRLPSGTIIAFDPVTTSMYSSYNDGVTWTRTATTTMVTATSTLVVPPTPIGNIVGYLVPPVAATGTVLESNRYIQAIYADGSLSGIASVPATPFTTGICQLINFKGWWIANGYYAMSGAPTTYRQRLWKTQADPFAGTVEADWTELPEGIMYITPSWAARALSFATV